jgi:hypothetical protein
MVVAVAATLPPAYFRHAQEEKTSGLNPPPMPSTIARGQGRKNVDHSDRKRTLLAAPREENWNPRKTRGKDWIDYDFTTMGSPYNL